MAEGLVEAVEVIYNVFEQEPAAELSPVAAQKVVGVIARMPFDEETFTAKLAPGRVSKRAISGTSTHGGIASCRA